jgi:hypothetical protein
MKFTLNQMQPLLELIYQRYVNIHNEISDVDNFSPKPLPINSFTIDKYCEVVKCINYSHADVLKISMFDNSNFPKFVNENLLESVSDIFDQQPNEKGFFKFNLIHCFNNNDIGISMRNISNFIDAISKTADNTHVLHSSDNNIIINKDNYYKFNIAQYLIATNVESDLYIINTIIYYLNNIH